MIQVPETRIAAHPEASLVHRELVCVLCVSSLGLQEQHDVRQTTNTKKCHSTKGNHTVHFSQRVLQDCINLEREAVGPDGGHRKYVIKVVCPCERTSIQHSLNL